MKKLILGAAICSVMLLSSPLVMAQDDHHQDQPQQGDQQGDQHGGQGGGQHGGKHGGQDGQGGGPGGGQGGGQGGGDMGFHDRGMRDGWYRQGGRMPSDYRGNDYVVSDYRSHHLHRPRHGYHWVRSDNGDFLLVAVTTGVIASIIAGGR